MKSYHKDPVLSAKKRRGRKDKVRKAKKHFCQPCGHAFESPSALKRHDGTKRHQVNAASVASEP